MSEPESDVVLDDTAAKINAFKKARDIEQVDFDVYVYRIVQDSNKKVRNPFLTKYENYLPDELEIAEKFRGGRYKLQAIWYENKKQRSESWSYEIDEESFPVQSPINSLPIKSGSDPTQTLMLLVADIVKSAYTTRAPIENDFTRRDPLELFGEVQGKMQEMYQRMMDIQGNVMERSFQMTLEKKYGLIEGSGTTAGDDEEENAGIMESGVVEIVKQVVDAAKLILPILGLPGAKPVVEGIKKNPAFSKYAELANNPLIVQEVARALRKEYGDSKAGLLLKSFGINMVPRPAPAPGVAPSRAPVQEVSARVVPAGKSKSRPGTKKTVKSSAKLSNVKKG